ncbi:sigma-54-dependent transcriptional regulator [Aquisalimonas asiatica]|uniref:Two-component system, NtrC family, C4-dicarboxylate transport response regulator DctD n=1 Tax=Aquisalimonas asiatica TaxID=406100 RepID=A0A1H8RG05_9GAMM|nr:sigma-54 dependent transcriptional regulator [Aquisalimonas asiatica]SEO65459.1 two-component system, NtrC family, C4-dicarboxylate transport response regulator DctD [Aquisalimonas asiatica]
MTEQGVTIYLVEDDEAMRSSVARWLRLADFHVEPLAAAAPLLETIATDSPAVVVSDVRMPDMDGRDLQQAVQHIDPDLPVILFTGHGDIDMAVEAMRNGCYDFIEKPFNAERLLESVRRACEKRHLVLENRNLRSQMEDLSGLHARLIGRSPAINKLRQEIIDMAPVDANVLVIGETGTGKEVVASCLHHLSPRHDQPLVAVNCAAIPETLAESELFGHEPGAFTSASTRRKGRLEEAHGGTLFLDEMADMPLEVQAKLLRAIQERSFNRLGSNTVRNTDFRLIAAINTDARGAIQRRELREDLYYRVNTIELHIPPLRERREDVPMLFSVFCEHAAVVYDRPVTYPDSATLTALMNHDWPGNVRELKNVAARYTLSSLPPEERLGSLLRQDNDIAPAPGEGLREQVQKLERQLIQDALRRHEGRITPVLEELQLPRRTLNEKMRRYGLRG